MSAIRRGGLAEDIVSYVRGQILSGQLKPGEKVDQEAIADALDVSRSPIREALIILGQEGLLDVTPRRGAFVANLSREDVIDHYELFGLISGRVAAMAADQMTADCLADLQAVHDQFAAASADEHSKLNDEFHRLINNAAPRRTRWLLRHLERSIPEGFYGTTPGWTERAVTDHQSIMDAISQRDSSSARQAMEEHLHAAGVAAVHALEGQGFWEEDE